MPKKPPKNAFFFYMLHFKQQEENRGVRFRNGLADVSTAASASWTRMTDQQKGPYEKAAKEAKLNGSSNHQPERYTSQGVAFSEIERTDQMKKRAEENMKKAIGQIVQDSYLKNTIDTQEYSFIAGNYFCKTIDGDYIPAELAIVKYCLKDGIIKKYHTYINPGKLPTGFAYEAKSYSEETHRLPVPPRAKGNSRYTDVLDEIGQFFGFNNISYAPNSKKVSEMPPLFTVTALIPIIKSFLQQLCMETEADWSEFKIYPLEEVFFILKREACKYGLDSADTGFPSIHVAAAMIGRDQYDYQQDIACDFHEREDASKFCALSCASRWSFIFSDHICLDLGIEMVPGKHVPNNSDVKLANTLKAELDDSRSMISMASTDFSAATSNATRLTDPTKYASAKCAPTASSVDYRSIASGSTSKMERYHDSEYPELGATPVKQEKWSDSREEERPRDPRNPWNLVKTEPDDAHNPWSKRNERKPREPHNEELTFSAVATGGSGRGLLLNNASERVFPRGFGRGLLPTNANVQSGGSEPLGRGRL